MDRSLKLDTVLSGMVIKAFRVSRLGCSLGTRGIICFSCSGLFDGLLVLMSLLLYPGNSYNANYLLFIVVLNTLVGLCMYLSGDLLITFFVLKNFCLIWSLTASSASSRWLPLPSIDLIFYCRKGGNFCVWEVCTRLLMESKFESRFSNGISLMFVIYLVTGTEWRFLFNGLVSLLWST